MWPQVTSGVEMCMGWDVACRVPLPSVFIIFSLKKCLKEEGVNGVQHWSNTGYHFPLGNISWGFWLFIAAPVSQFDVFTFLTPDMCLQKGDRKVSSWVSSNSQQNLYIPILSMVYVSIISLPWSCNQIPEGPLASEVSAGQCFLELSGTIKQLQP